MRACVHAFLQQNRLTKVDRRVFIDVGTGIDLGQHKTQKLQRFSCTTPTESEPSTVTINDLRREKEADYAVTGARLDTTSLRFRYKTS